MLEANDTGARALQKKVFKVFFQAISKKVFKNFLFNFNNQKKKIVLSSRRGQGNFRGLDLRGQGLQNVSSRTLPPLIMSKRMMSRL